MKKAIIITSLAALTAIAADAPIPNPEEVAKTYAKTFTRLNDKPKSISAHLIGMCTDIPDDEKYGPHSRSYVNHFRNELARTAKGDFPPGSVLVKEKLRAEKDGEKPVLSGATGMIKQPKGTAPATGDWLFFEVWEGKVHPTKAATCAGCHSGAKRDYVFTDLAELKKKQAAAPNAPGEVTTAVKDRLGK